MHQRKPPAFGALILGGFGTGLPELQERSQASKANAAYAKEKGIVNIVFNKIVGSLKNIVSSKNMETRLKKWRSGIEANISNLQRGFNLSRCNWKGFGHFSSKVYWSVIAYNIRVMAAAMIQQM